MKGRLNDFNVYAYLEALAEGEGERAERLLEPVQHLLERPVWIYEGAILFVTDISCNYRDSPHKGDWRGTMTEGPRLSRPADDRLALQLDEDHPRGQLGLPRPEGALRRFQTVFSFNANAAPGGAS